jgi:hypothetical protein
MPKFASSFANWAGTDRFDQLQKCSEAGDHFGPKRPRKGLRCYTSSTSTRSSEFPVEISLEKRNDHIEAQNLRGKAVLGAKFLRPFNPALPFVLRHDPIRHGAIISPGLPARNVDMILGSRIGGVSWQPATP